MKKKTQNEKKELNNLFINRKSRITTYTSYIPYNNNKLENGPKFSPHHIQVYIYIYIYILFFKKNVWEKNKMNKNNGIISF